MRDMGVLFINDERILVLFEATKNGRRLKIRKPGGWLGSALSDESAYLKEKPELLAKLKAGEVITV